MPLTPRMSSAPRDGRDGADDYDEELAEMEDRRSRRGLALRLNEVRESRPSPMGSTPPSVDATGGRIRTPTVQRSWTPTVRSYPGESPSSSSSSASGIPESPFAGLRLSSPLASTPAGSVPGSARSAFARVASESRSPKRVPSLEEPRLKRLPSLCGGHDGSGGKVEKLSLRPRNGYALEFFPEAQELPTPRLSADAEEGGPSPKALVGKGKTVVTPTEGQQHAQRNEEAGGIEPRSDNDKDGEVFLLMAPGRLSPLPRSRPRRQTPAPTEAPPSPPTPFLRTAQEGSCAISGRASTPSGFRTPPPLAAASVSRLQGSHLILRVGPCIVNPGWGRSIAGKRKRALFST